MANMQRWKGIQVIIIIIIIIIIKQENDYSAVRQL